MMSTRAAGARHPGYLGRMEQPDMDRMTRREFVALTATAAATAATAAPLARSRPSPAAVTAQDIVDRIKKNVGVEWKAETVDAFKAGDPATAVTGIVTTALASLDVLERAVKAGANLVITCEPTFYARADNPAPPAGRGGAPPPGPDRVYAGKTDFIKKHGLVVFRFSDHWRLRRPDPLAQGLAAALGWPTLTADDPARVTIAEASLEALAARVKKTLNIRGGLRVIGDRQARIRTVALLPGSTPIQASLKALPTADVLIAGEVREWESVEYARDIVTAGIKKGMILTGRIVSEDPGMNVCAAWLKTIVPEVKTTWMAAGDPYWRPL
jgi:putative NIF3 family GTP cyclohydrolase 1 type 2